MYNRYIPQPDGSYSRRRMQEQPAPPPPPPRQEPQRREERWQPEQENTPQKQDASPQFSPGPTCHARQRRVNSCHQRSSQRPIPPPPKQEHKEYRQSASAPRQETSVLSFLKQLLPKEFDTGDLLIVLLLLLMSGDCKEDQNTAILTLVLYLFM